jgi:ubiquinone/menaquinone biosynthesis C-methylase UbiE
MEDQTIKERVQAQFGSAAQSYVTSAGHARGDDLRRLVELAGLRGDERVLDVATGGGHTALAFAPHVREVVASDLTAPMLAAAEKFIRGQGAANVSFERADAEDLPFADASFDIVTARIAPHHFPHPQRFIAEVARVLRAGGRFLLDDNMAPEDAELDQFMNNFERWRDPSHVRAHTLSEWRAWIEQAGMQVEHVEPLSRKRYDFADWTARMRMPELERAALEAWLLQAPPRCAEFFQIVAEDGRVRSLSALFGIVVARRPG